MSVFKSEKHRLKMLELERKGKIKKGTVKAWEQDTKNADKPLVPKSLAARFGIKGKP